MKALNWFEVSTLDDGVNYGTAAQAVVFATDYWMTPDCVIPCGSRARVSCNSLNELCCYLEVTLDEPRKGVEDGIVFFGGHLDPGADCHGPAEEREDDAKEWFKPSPLTVEEVTPYYCTGCGHSVNEPWSLHRVRCIGECPQTLYPPPKEVK
jgi:hypothetical protein